MSVNSPDLRTQQLLGLIYSGNGRISRNSSNIDTIQKSPSVGSQSSEGSTSNPEENSSWGKYDCSSSDKEEGNVLRSPRGGKEVEHLRPTQDQVDQSLDRCKKSLEDFQKLLPKNAAQNLDESSKLKIKTAYETLI